MFSSIDPYMRSLLLPPSEETYQDAYAVNEPIRGLAIGKSGQIGVPKIPT